MEFTETPQTEQPQPSAPLQNHRFSFFGDGKDYFGIIFLNALFTILTLGLYYPWARAKALQYRYQVTEIAGSRFTFHGTGNEMFKGFIKAFIIFAVLYGILIYGGIKFQSKELGTYAICLLIFFAGITFLIPIAVHGSMRYRMSRTSWRGIHFMYTGKLGKLFGIFYGGLFLTIITFGIYGSWLEANIRRYVISNIKVGNAKLVYMGSGGDLFWIRLKMGFLAYITLGIYFFWYRRDLNRFFFNNLYIVQNGNYHSFTTNLTAGDCFRMYFLNTLLIVITLGIYAPWAIMYNTKTVLENVELQYAFDPSLLVQETENYADATGDDLFAMLDLGITI